MRNINENACQRCGGRLMLEEWPGEVEVVCLQCGRRTYPNMKTEPTPLTAAERSGRLARVA